MGKRGREQSSLVPLDERHKRRSCFSLSPLLLLSHLTRSLVILPVRLYQLTLGAVLPDCCRFSPTCSQYVIEAVQKHGALRGAWLGLKRLLRCNRYFRGGYDPVP